MDITNHIWEIAALTTHFILIIIYLYKFLARRFDKIDQKFKETREDILHLDTKMYERFNELKEVLYRQEKRMDNIYEHILDLKDDIHFVDNVAHDILVRVAAIEEREYFHANDTWPRHTPIVEIERKRRPGRPPRHARSQ